MLTWEVTALRLLAAAAACALLGWERQRAGKPVGVRTLALVGIATAGFVIMGLHFDAATHGPSRMAANVVTGLGFLGAGVIFRPGDEPHGLTTAALVWTSGAVGIAMAAGHFVLGGLLAAFSLAVLRLRHPGD